MCKFHKSNIRMNLASRVTLYDLLTMVVSGALILVLCGCVPSNSVWEIFVWSAASYIVGMIYNGMVEWLFTSLNLRNREGWIRKARRQFEKERRQGAAGYYEAYYRCFERSALACIPVLEAQVAFIRNMIPLLAIYGIRLVAASGCICEEIYFLGGKLCVCKILIILILVIAALCSLFYNRQMKIHRLIWEGEFYLKQIEQRKTERVDPKQDENKK